MRQINLLLAIALVTSAASADDIDDIRRVVIEGQKAGFEKHDHAKYMTMWTTDSKVITTRPDGNSKYDRTLTYKDLQAVHKLTFRGSPHRKLTFSQVRIKVDGDSAVMTSNATMMVGKRSRYRRYQSEPEPLGGKRDRRERLDRDMVDYVETYKLRRTKAGWKVYENRVIAGEPSKNAKQEFAMLDRKVATLKDSNPYFLLNACANAHRHAEAYAIAKKLTEDHNAIATDWSMRGDLALRLGKAAEAETCFKKALAIDPNADVPLFMRPKLKFSLPWSESYPKGGFDPGD